jgi:hypothetical protein
MTPLFLQVFFCMDSVSFAMIDEKARKAFFFFFFCTNFILFYYLEKKKKNGELGTVGF